MAKILKEPSRTFNEYLLIPGYSQTGCTVSNVVLKTPVVKYYLDICHQLYDCM